MEESISSCRDSAASNFKSYEELNTRLDTVLSGTISVGNVTNSMTEDDLLQAQ